MKTYILNLVVLLALLASCEEEPLTPSFADEDRAITQADKSKPLVAHLVDKFNCGLLFEYDENLDFRYTAEDKTTADKWNSIDFPMMNTVAFEDENGAPISYDFNFPDRTITATNYQEYVDASLNFMDSTLFCYFDASKKIGSQFPNKILLSNELKNNSSTGFYYLEMTDSRTADDTGNAYLRSVCNRNAIVFNGNLQDIARTWESYKKENLYVFILRMLTNNDWVNQMPKELFPESVTKLYSDTIGHAYGYVLTTENLELAPGFDAEEPIDANNWYQNLGFIDSYYFNTHEAQYSTSDESMYSTASEGFGTERQILNKHFFPDKTNDVLSFLNELIHRKAETTDETVGWNDLPAPCKARAKGFAQFYINMGIDMVGINPDVAVLLKEKKN